MTVSIIVLPLIFKSMSSNIRYSKYKHFFVSGNTSTNNPNVSEMYIHDILDILDAEMQKAGDSGDVVCAIFPP